MVEQALLAGEHEIGKHQIGKRALDIHKLEAITGGIVLILAF